MKYHIVWNGEVVASFKNEHQRKQVLAYWKERFCTRLLKSQHETIN